MPKVEKKILDWLEKNRNILFFGIISIVAFIIRYKGLDMISGDMYVYLIPWYDEITSRGGMWSLSKQVGDYNILYQFLIAILTYLPIDKIHAIKYISIIFDYALACACGTLYCTVKGKDRLSMEFGVVYAAVLFLPTVILNSAYWGQCDSIYTFFLVMTLLAFNKESYKMAFVWYGIAFACKLQAIFLLPFILCLYFYRKRFSIALALIAVGVFWLTGLPAFIMGRSLLTPFTIYANQTLAYQKMWVNVASIWQLLGDNYEWLKGFAILTTISIFGVALLLVLEQKIAIEGKDRLLVFACWCVWTCVLFLPSMHERYTYLVDLLLLVLTFVDRKYLKIFLIEAGVSLITYGYFLFQGVKIGPYLSAIVLLAWGWYSWKLICPDKGDTVH